MTKTLQVQIEQAGQREEQAGATGQDKTKTRSRAGPVAGTDGRLSQNERNPEGEGLRQRKERGERDKGTRSSGTCKGHSGGRRSGGPGPDPGKVGTKTPRSVARAKYPEWGGRQREGQSGLLSFSVSASGHPSLPRPLSLCRSIYLSIGLLASLPLLFLLSVAWVYVGKYYSCVPSRVRCSMSLGVVFDVLYVWGVLLNCTVSMKRRFFRNEPIVSWHLAIYIAIWPYRKRRCQPAMRSLTCSR